MVHTHSWGLPVTYHLLVTDITLCFNLEINLTNKPDGLPVSELVDLWKVGVPKPRKLI